MTRQTGQGKQIPGGFSKSLAQHRKKILSLIPSAKPAAVFYKNCSTIAYQAIKIPILTYRPNDTKKYLPTILYIPGTAFSANAPAYTDLVCSHMAQKSHCQVMAINLPLAPEYQFPQNIYAGYAALKFLLNSPPAWTKIDLEKVALLGYSSGGNFATTIAMLAKKENLSLAKLILISPWLDLSRSTKGFEEKYESKDTSLPAAFLDWILDLYIPREINYTNPLLSPFWQSKQELQHLPPTDIIVGEYDRFRGDSEAFYLSLLEANVDVNKLIVQRQDHSFWWQQIETVQAIARRIGISLNSIPHSRLKKWAGGRSI